MPVVSRKMLGSVLFALALAPFIGSVGVLAQADQADDLDQQLAEKYAPIVMLKAQDGPCDSEGEPYAPASVDIVLDNPDVLLREVGDDDPVVLRAPSAADLFERSDQFFLDFLGNALEPGCVYETDFDRYTGTVPGERQVLVYAHIARQDDRPDQIALQYWFYWYFNDWNNKHESDWEGIQLVFDASTVEEALASEPISVGFAQHEGGERADWDSSKLQREGDRPVVYPSAGSHASYFGSALYLGRSSSEGFGCDTTLGPSDRVAADVALLPTTVDDPNDPLAWLSFEGRWGERQSGPFNGPTGPVDKERWDQPIDWQDGLRSSSVVVPSGGGRSNEVVASFCGLVDWGSGLFIAFRVAPISLLITAIVLLLAAVWAVRRTAWSSAVKGPLVRRRRAGQIIRAAAGTYLRHARPLIAFGLVFVPVAFVVAILVVLIASLPLIKQLIELSGDSSATTAMLGVVAQYIAGLVTYLVVTAMVASYLAMRSQGDNRRPVRASAAAVWRRAPTIAVEWVKAVLIVFGLMLTVVGIPWGIRQLIRYQFMIQAVMVEGVDRGQALRRSSELVKGRWWHTALLVGLFNATIALSGTTIGLVLLVGFGLPIWLFTVIVTLGFALVALPLGAVAQTLLYGDAVAEERGMMAGDDPMVAGTRNERHADEKSPDLAIDQA